MSGENPSTYFVQDRRNQKELTRLMIQDRMFTKGMGGVLAEQADPTVFHRVLDVGCGPGGWVIEAAQAYPEMSFVGIDISQRMIKYAHAQAEACQVKDRIEFHVTDVLGTLDLPAASFDLVNLRFTLSFLRTWDWSNVLGKLLQVASPGGIIRITDGEIVPQSNSPALTQLCEMFQCAFFRAGHLFTNERTGLTSQLAQLLSQYGYEQVQTKSYILEYRAGTEEGTAFYENTMLIFQTTRSFIQKWGCAAREYDAIYRQARDEMCRPDFLATLNMLTAWGSKPKSKL